MVSPFSCPLESTFLPNTEDFHEFRLLGSPCRYLLKGKDALLGFLQKTQEITPTLTFLHSARP